MDVDCKNIIFSISTRCENESHTSLALNCVKSIKKYYPDSEIVVVDSNSPDKSHIDKLKEYDCIISDLKNVNYEAGAIWDTYNKFNKKTYVFLQDSMVLLGNIDEFLVKDYVVLGNIYSNWFGCDDRTIKWIKENVSKTKYQTAPENFNMVQYNSMIISRDILDKFKSKNLDKILPIDKVGSSGMERIFGIALTLEGHPISKETQLPQNLINKTWIRRL
jgi:hypothetical protein